MVKAMVFPIVMYGCESWTIKKAGLWRIEAFELWCWRRLLRVPWTARRSNQSSLKEISPEYSLEELMLKLKLHSLATWCEELRETEAGGVGDDRRRDSWMVGWYQIQWTWVWASSGRWWRRGKPGMLQSVGSQRVGHKWTTTTQKKILFKTLLLIENTSGHRRALTEVYHEIDVIFMPANTISILQSVAQTVISTLKSHNFKNATKFVIHGKWAKYQHYKDLEEIASNFQRK